MVALFQVIWYDFFSPTSYSIVSSRWYLLQDFFLMHSIWHFCVEVHTPILGSFFWSTEVILENAIINGRIYGVINKRIISKVWDTIRQIIDIHRKRRELKSLPCGISDITRISSDGMPWKGLTNFLKNHFDAEYFISFSSWLKLIINKIKKQYQKQHECIGNDGFTYSCKCSSESKIRSMVVSVSLSGVFLALCASASLFWYCLCLNIKKFIHKALLLNIF